MISMMQSRVPVTGPVPVGGDGPAGAETAGATTAAPATGVIAGAEAAGLVVGGVDTHGRTHHAAVVDHLGRQLGDREFPATAAGYRDLLVWMACHGTVSAVGIEGTGAFGAELARVATAAGIPVLDVNRPDRAARRRNGKSDPLDAYAAAHAVISGRASTLPKARTGNVEAIRVLRVVRNSAVRSRTQVMNQIKSILTSAPGPLRERYAGLDRVRLIRALARQRLTTTPGSSGAVSDPLTATKTALRHLARRYEHLLEEIADLDEQIAPLVQATAPSLLELFGVGPDTAGQLLATAGDNPDRVRSEAAFAHLCGVAPIPASSGNTHRHRLNRGGDRAANKALHTIALARLHYDPRTRAYVAKRTAQGLSKKDIIRCLKRYIAREVYAHLISPPDVPGLTACNSTPTQLSGPDPG